MAIIPLDLDGYLFSEECESSRGPQLRKRLAANFQRWEQNNALFEREIEKVITALRTKGGRQSPPKPKLGKIS